MAKTEENKHEERKVYYDLYPARDGKRSVAIERQTQLTFVSTNDLVQIQLKKDLLKEVQMYWLGDRRLWPKTRERILSLSMEDFDNLWCVIRWWTINIFRPELTPPLDELLNDPKPPTSAICSQQQHWTRLVDPDKLQGAGSQIVEQLQKLRDQEINSIKSTSYDK